MEFVDVMGDRKDINLPVFRGELVTERRLFVGIVFVCFLLAAAMANFTRSQEGPALRISDALRVGQLRLSQERSKQASNLEGPDSEPFDWVDGKCISGSSSMSLSDGVSTLKRGFISRETLTRRLGLPVGTCTVADSQVWIYDFTLSSPVNNGGILTSSGHLHVFVETIPFLGLYLNNFELAIDGSGLERWADNDPRLQ